MQHPFPPLPPPRPPCPSSRLPVRHSCQAPKIGHPPFIFISLDFLPAFFLSPSFSLLSSSPLPLSSPPTVPSLTPSSPLPPLPPLPPLLLYRPEEEARKRGRFTRAVISASLSFPFPSLSFLSRTLSVPRSPSEIIKEPTSNPIEPCRRRQCSRAITHSDTHKHMHARDRSMWQGYAKHVKHKTSVFTHIYTS